MRTASRHQRRDRVVEHGLDEPSGEGFEQAEVGVQAVGTEEGPDPRRCGGPACAGGREQRHDAAEPRETLLQPSQAGEPPGDLPDRSVTV
ncbi:MAG: hypothetical protein ACNA8R_10910 [Nitriliruptoraceae bacterium]